MNTTENILCSCGCGNFIKIKPHHKYYFPRFISGHNSKGIKRMNSKLLGRTYEDIYGDRADEIKRKHSLSLKNRFFAPREARICACGKDFQVKIVQKSKYCSKICSKNFRKAWNTGLTKETSDKVALYGRKIALANIGKASKFKGITNRYSNDTLLSISNSVRELWRDKHYRERVCKSHQGKKQSEATIKKRLLKIQATPNNFEVRCGVYLEIVFPGLFRYCGDGSFLICGRSIDFVSEYLKIAILCNGIYWHLKKLKFENTRENKIKIEQKEAKLFENSDFKILFLWEDEIKDMINNVSIQENE